MPDESCRACGGLLMEYSQCAGCKKVIRLICKSCHTKTMEQFHSDCILGEDSYRNSRNSLFEPLPNVTIA